MNDATMVAAMDLVPFWIFPEGRLDPPKPGTIVIGQIGFGVTAFDLDDAVWMLRQTSSAPYISPGLQKLVVRRDVRVAELPTLVQERMGPIVVRGVWYPSLRPFSPHERETPR